jgi:gluconolactonase
MRIHRPQNLENRRHRLARPVAALVFAAALGAGATAVQPAASAAPASSSPSASSSACPAGAVYGSPLPSANVSAERISGRFNFTEGPTWVASQGALLFSVLQPASGSARVQDSAIWRFTPPDRFELYRDHAGSNGLAVDPDRGRLVAATHDQRNVSAFDLTTGTRTVLAANYQGRHFNSPNDVTIAADGTVYFSDPNFQRGNRADEMNRRTGLFRVRGGQVELLDNSINQPNGVVLSPDGKNLYVGAFGENRIYRYPIGDDGRLGTRTLFAAMTSPDSATVDCAGNIYWASYNEGRIHVFDPQGTAIGTVTAGANVTNAAFGDADGQTLYITSGSGSDFGLYRVRLNVPGNPY